MKRQDSTEKPYGRQAIALPALSTRVLVATNG